MQRGTPIAGSNEPVRKRLEVPSTSEAVGAVEKELLDELRTLGYDESSVFAVRLAFEEAANNARSHGNAGDQGKRITVSYELDSARATIEIADEGAGYDPATVPDPTCEENIEIPAGRGLTLIRAFMTDVQIVPPGNRIRMVYERPSA